MSEDSRRRSDRASRPSTPARGSSAPPPRSRGSRVDATDPPPDSRAPPAGIAPDAPVLRGSFTIINVRGLHARAATKLVQLATRYPCEIIISSPDGQEANAKSVMGVLLLCGSVGTVIDVRARGPNAEHAIEAIGALIADRFGEAE